MKSQSLALLLIAAGFGATDLVAQSSSEDGLRSALASRIQREMKARGIPAVSFAWARDGAMGVETAFGLSDLENGVKATAKTRFRTASIAKPMTAVALLRLVEKGKLDLDHPISRYCPEWKGKRWPVSARHLLAHLGGVRHYTKPGESRGTRHFVSLSRSMACFADDPLEQEPGTKYRYTTYGFTLLGRAIETVSQQDYVTHLSEALWRPLGMEQTTLDHSFLVLKDRARGYIKLSPRRWKALPEVLRKELAPDAVVSCSLHDTSMKVAGGGLLSTAGDLVRFGQGMLDDRVVTADTRQAMWTKQKTKAGKEVGYGLGWSLSYSDEDGPIVAHGGAQAGAACYLQIVPRKKLVLAVMTNLQGFRPQALVNDLRARLLGR